MLDVNFFDDLRIGLATADDIRRRLADLQKSERDTVLVATRAGTVIGWIHLARVPSLEADAFAEIRGLVVTESERGTGAGSRLVQVAESWACDHSCERLRLRSNVIRTATRHFYENRGFTVVKISNVFDKPVSV